MEKDAVTVRFIKNNMCYYVIPCKERGYNMNGTELKLNDKAFDDVMLKHSLALKMLETELKIMIQNYEYTNNCKRNKYMEE